MTASIYIASTKVAAYKRPAAVTHVFFVVNSNSSISCNAKSTNTVTLC